MNFTCLLNGHKWTGNSKSGLKMCINCITLKEIYKDSSINVHGKAESIRIEKCERIIKEQNMIPFSEYKKMRKMKEVKIS